MKKLLIQILSFVLAWSVIIACFNWLFASNYAYSYMMMQEMYQCPENIDVLFLGSSHAYRSLDTALADEVLGKKTFNVGSDGQLFATSYYLLREVAEKNQLETVYLDTVFMISARSIPENESSLYTISDHMKWSWNKVEYLWETGGIRSFVNGVFCTCRRNLRNINVIKNIRSRKLAVGDYTELTNGMESYRGEGFVYMDMELEEGTDFKEKGERYDLTAEIPMVDDAYEYLIKIINYCQEKEIRLVLIDQPMPNELLSAVKGYDNYVSFLSGLSQEYGIDYMNFNLYKGYDKSLDDYYDENHLNGAGAEKYTEILCNTVNALDNTDKELDDFFYKEYSYAP